ncbi:MAG TPA: hypothetical protein VNW97_12405 [Candidatus Saccharimonadales bacterium]|jgi:hypothetical protein|nr:hypothetical protein [Candidatus Saccharimonadales bacterium]
MHAILGYISGAGILSVLAFVYHWFLLKTDVEVAYNWSCQGINFYPNFDLRNRSGSKICVVGNIAYTRGGGKEIVTFDNKSLWGKELKPGTIVYLSAAPVSGVSSMAECLMLEVTVRLQNGKEFKGQGPGQLRKGWLKYAYALRQRIEKTSLPLPS